MKKYLSILFVLLMSAAPALAGEVSADISLGGRSVNGTGTETSAKFLEYRDLDDQITSELNGRLTDDRFHMEIKGENLGYNDQSVSLKGGVYGQVKFSLFYDELTHNYSLDDLAPYDGIGTTTLTVPAAINASSAASKDTSLWTALDYSVDRHQVGASFELTFETPYFVAVNVTQTEKEGLIPWGVNIDSRTGGSDSAEIPAPVDTKTTNLMVKAGYRTDSLFAQADVTFSSFENDKDRLQLPTSTWPDYNNAQPGPVYFGPDNEMVQIGGQLVLRDLPMQSVLAIRGSHAMMESDAPAAGIDDGELTYTKAAVTLRSRPAAKLDTELAYNFLQKDNKATSFGYVNSAAVTNQTHVFEYSKHKAEASAGYRLNNDNRLKAGYNYQTIDRSHMRFDAEETDQHTVFAEWKNTAMDLATAKVRYERMDRSSEFKGAEKAASSGNNIYEYVRPFDVADKNQDKLRLMLDMSPTELVDLGVEFNMSRGEYDKTVYGRTDERASGIILDASVALPFDSKLTGYAELETSKNSGTHVRYTGNPTFPLTVATTNTLYDWSIERKDISKSFGLKLDVPLMSKRLNLSAAFDYLQNDGKAEFTTNRTDGLLDNIEYDDYVKKSLELKAKYAVSENLSVTAGYEYEKYELDDYGYSNYLLTSPNNDYLTGAYADMDYSANIVYASLNYKF